MVYKDRPLVKFAATIILVLMTIYSYSQKARVIGKVLDGKTNEPIPFVNIYFNGTSIGTTSDSLGRFEINNVPIEFSELIASSIGFKTLSTNLQLTPDKVKVVEFKMISDVTVLSSIVIRSNRDKQWEKLYTDFCNYFIGKTNNAKQTTILNPDVLDLDYNSSTKTLTASAHEPIELENLSMGYHISITLEKFEASDRHYTIQIKSYFKAITPKNELQALQWQKNRVETYKGSKRHFFQSIVRKSIDQQGFSVKKSLITPYSDISEFIQSNDIGPYSPNLKIADLLLDSIDGNFRVLKTGIFKITHERDDENGSGKSTTTSLIEVNDSYLNVDPNGIVKLPANFWLLGYFEKLRLADQLPLDYDFMEEEARLFRNSEARRGKLIGMVTDEDDRALSDATVFVNNGLTQAKTNTWGQFKFEKLPSGEYPMVFTHPAMRPILKVIPVDTSGWVEAVVALKAQGIDLINYEPVNNRVKKKVIRAMQPRYREFQISMRNPEDLYFKDDEKTTKLIVKKPLIFVSKKLGFQWTFYGETFSIINHEMSNTGYFKFDTLTPKNSREKREWLANRRTAYHGTWNQFVTNLIDGKLSENAIEVYENPSDQNKEPIPYDSLIELRNGKLLLKLQKKAQVQFLQTDFRKGKIKSLYLVPKIPQVQISMSGVFDPLKLDIISPGSGRLPLIPIDHTVYKRKFKKAGATSLIEKIYVHTDKPYYYPGDTIWLKGFLKYEYKSGSDLTSKVFYLDLLNDKGILIRSLKLPIENGKTNGDLFLSEDLPRGDYTLRAYTRYSAACNNFFFKPIPVLPRNESIASNEDEKDVYHPDLSVKVLKEKEVFQVGDTIGLMLEITDIGQAASGEFSVAITDQVSVGTLESTSISATSFFTNKVNQICEVNLQPEQGLTHKIKILNGDADEVYTLSALVIKNGEAISTPIKGNIGSFMLNFKDSTTVFLKCTDSKNREFEVEFLDHEIPMTFLPKPIPYQIKKAVPRSNLISYVSSDSVSLLDEVFVKAKRIVTQKSQKVPTEFVLGNVYNTLNNNQLQRIRKTKDLVEELHSIIPQLNNPLIRFSLFVNGRMEDPLILPTFPANEISRVDVYPRPMNAVAIYTESMIPYTGRNPNLYKLMGFSTMHKFYGGNSELNDFRSTVYWNHTLKIESGVGSFRFPTSKSSGSYKVVIEGLTNSGKFFRIVDYIKIADR